jgi:transposase
MARMQNGATKRRERRTFTDEFKVGAVRLVLDEGKTISAAAQDLDLSPSVLANWVRQGRADRSNGKTGLTSEERAELARLRKEVRVLRMERDILKKATAFFARENA